MKKLSEEHKKRIRLSCLGKNKGNKRPDLTAYNKRRRGVFKHSEETKRKIGDTQRGRSVPDEVKMKVSGKNSAHYKTGRKVYRKTALKAFVNECFFCRKNLTLVVHHIDENRNNNELANLKIVCRSCHKRKCHSK